MSATDELRRLLDERGVNYRVDDMPTLKRTQWKSAKPGVWLDSAVFLEFENGTTDFTFPSSAVTPEQAIAATLDGGKLRAEQVRKTVEKHWHDLPAEYDMPEATALPEYSYDWQAIADELNARAERTCEIVEWHEARDRHEIGNNRVRFSCGHFGTCHFKFCAECGAKVVGE